MRRWREASGSFFHTVRWPESPTRQQDSMQFSGRTVTGESDTSARLHPVQRQDGGRRVRHVSKTPCSSAAGWWTESPTRQQDSIQFSRRAVGGESDTSARLHPVQWEDGGRRVRHVSKTPSSSAGGRWAESPTRQQDSIQFSGRTVGGGVTDAYRRSGRGLAGNNYT